MMDERIEVSLTRIASCIDALGSDEFTTAELIRKYSGQICSNLGGPRGSIHSTRSSVSY